MALQFEAMPAALLLMLLRLYGFTALLLADAKTAKLPVSLLTLTTTDVTVAQDRKTN